MGEIDVRDQFSWVRFDIGLGSIVFGIGFGMVTVEVWLRGIGKWIGVFGIVLGSECFGKREG